MIFYGLAFGLACVLLSLQSEGGNIQAFLSPSAFLIVVGGSLGAAFIGFRAQQLQEFVAALGRGSRLRSRREAAVTRLSRYAAVSRHQGALRLEKEAAGETEPLLKAGLDLVVSGVTPDSLKGALERRTQAELARLETGERFFEALGGYAPTFGIIGTVMGLVSVLGHLSQPAQLAQGVSAAFVATFYGILFANLVFLPLATRIREHTQEYEQMLEVLVAGLISVQAGEHPRTLTDCLSDGVVTAPRRTLRAATQEGQRATAAG